ncbi:MAG: lytic transglycosylase domain-containing protein, partial [Muribaculaceae bacterium]|nr:lytic transglycosylase domain-containing protein [Muribaculaceae bacterium]
MKISNRIICLAAAGALAWLGAMAKPAPSILSIKDTIHDNSVIVPESFETDVKKMQENWYLKNYAQLDRNADSRPNPVTTDQDYIDRLGLIPSVIEMPFNSIVKNFIVMYSERKRQLVENMLGMSLYYMPIFEEALERHGLPLELKYLPVIESALNPSAVSRAGAAGLWQFMPGTATQLGLEINSLVDMRRDPISSSEAAARYLKQLYGIFGDWSLAIASYNCGPGNVAKAIRRAGGGKKDFWEIYPFLPAETRGYVPAFIAANYVMNHYDKHNISPALARKPILTDTVHISRRVPFRQISDVLAIP